MRIVLDGHPSFCSSIDSIPVGQLFVTYAGEVRRVLGRILGRDSELEDVLHNVFVAAYSSLENLRDEAAVRSWLIGIAIRQARKWIRKRQRGQFIDLTAPDELPEPPAKNPSGEVMRALRAVDSILGRMPSQERLAFTHRFIQGMDLTEVATACNVSLSTTKRRIGRAQIRFREAALRDPALHPFCP